MKALRRIWAVMKKETFHITRDTVVLMVCFIAPLFLTILMGAVYVEQKVTNIPIVIYDGDQSDLSRMIINGFNDSERLKVVKYANSYDELKEEIDSQRADMGIVIPADLKKNVKSGKSAEVGVIYNGTNTLVMSTAGTAANQVVATISAGVNMKIMQGTGISSKKALNAVQAISFKSRTWYNPTASYGPFMLMGILGTTLQQLAFLAVALSFSRERESGAWRNLIFSKLKSKEIITAKFLLYFVIFFIDAIIMFSLAINVFQVPQIGSLALIGLLFTVFLSSVLMIGICLSAIIKSQVQAIEISMIIAVPSFILSGYTWPAMAMPEIIQKISNALPLTHFLHAMKAVTYMNQGYDVIRDDVRFLIGLTLLFVPINVFMVQRRMKKG